MSREERFAYGGGVGTRWAEEEEEEEEEEETGWMCGKEAGEGGAVGW